MYVNVIVAHVSVISRMISALLIGVRLARGIEALKSPTTVEYSQCSSSGRTPLGTVLLLVSDGKRPGARDMPSECRDESDMR